MNDILKQRLVGALILVALGVVFWPIIFVDSGEKIADQRSIPVPPAVSTADIDAPDQTGLRTSPEPAITGDGPLTQPLVVDSISGSTASEQGALPEDLSGKLTAPTTPSNAISESDSSGVRTTAPEPLAMDNNGVPVAWTLQVATVSSAEKAENLRKQLLEMKQKAYISTVQTGGKSLYRVCIGPKFERVELEKLQAGINAKFGVHSMVARYVP